MSQNPIRQDKGGQRTIENGMLIALVTLMVIALLALMGALISDVFAMVAQPVDA